MTIVAINRVARQRNAPYQTYARADARYSPPPTAQPLAHGASTIGRDPAVTSPSAPASWHHASVEVSGAGGVIEDLGSKNGTVVNGVRISAPTVLSDGDESTSPGPGWCSAPRRAIETKTAASP